MPEAYWAAIATVVVIAIPCGRHGAVGNPQRIVERARWASAIHAGIASGCNDTSDGNRVQFDYFVVRLRIGFGGTDEIDVIADRLSTLVARLRIDTYKE